MLGPWGGFAGYIRRHSVNDTLLVGGWELIKMAVITSKQCFHTKKGCLCAIVADDLLRGGKIEY